MEPTDQIPATNGPPTERPPERPPVKRALVGRPRASHELEDTLLRKLIALPVFASDPLSSVAYATEGALVVLVAASFANRDLVLPLSIAIAVLLAIVVLSYRQTLKAYDTSGGAYVVAKDNLGTLPALLAAAALLTDYILTVAVSVAAGVFAITSAAPSLGGHRVELSLAFIALVTVANLRGVKEAGVLFALPTYGFVAVLYAMIGTGIVKCATGECPHPVAPNPIAAGTGALGVFVLLKAFASGSAALTGVEAISNGVNAFRPPQAKNAAKTLSAMAVIAITLFLGVSYLTMKMDIHPSETVSVVSQIARGSFPEGSASAPLYYAVQALTFAILVLAANTAFQGFPRLAAMLAQDRFFPRQFVNLGDRLVLSNGIVVLSLVASLLIWAFHADVNALIHLYVLGVFTAFTLSQAGMVRYWLRRRDPGWRRSLAINAVGAAATGIVLAIVIQTKFLDGAWMVTIAIPAFVVGFYGVNRHYRKISRRLRAGAEAVKAAPPATNTVVLPVSELNEATRLAVWYAKTIAGDNLRAVHVPMPGKRDPRGRWWEFSGGLGPLEVLSPEEGWTDAVLEYVWKLPRGESSFVTVVVPEQFRKPSMVEELANRGAFSLKLRLLAEPGVVITDVPLVGREAPGVPKRPACRVLVSGAHGASLRAINYVRSLGFEDALAVFFAFDEEESRRIRREWSWREVDFPLEIVQAPYRDIGDPLLRYLRQITIDPDAVAVVVMPELVLTGWRKLLHNQRALYIKRLLLFEPRVILSSVPYQLVR
jgi:amino acid transporter